MTPVPLWWLGCTPDPRRGPPPDRDPATHSAEPRDSDPIEPAIEVACDPTDNALRFACRVEVQPPQAVELRWRRADGTGPERVATSGGDAATHALAVRFLAPETAYDLAAVALGSGIEATATLEAGTPPAAVGSWLVTLSGAPKVPLLGTANACERDAHAVVYDTATGALVWYQDLDPDGVLGVLDMIRFTPEGTVAGETHGRVVEVDLDGGDRARFAVDYGGEWGLHHELFAKDGRYWSQFQDTIGDLTVDPVVELAPDGTERHRWDPREHLSIPADAAGDWLHTNALFIDDGGDLFVSWMHRDTIARVAAAPGGGFGDVRWVLGPDDGALGTDFVLDWSGVDGPDGFSAQHNLSLRRDGRLQLLDNLHGRALILTLDEAAGTGTVDAAFRTREPDCGAQGTAMETATGDVIVACFGPWLGEYAVATGERTWEGELRCRDGGRAKAIRWYPLDAWQ